MRADSPLKPAGQPAGELQAGGSAARNTARAMLRPRLVVCASAVGSAGLVVHNLFEFPWQALYHAETVSPIAVTVLLAGAALARPGRATALVLGGWGLVTVVGGGLSVLPLQFLPFRPEQSVLHYALHVVYAAAQIPLLRIGRRALSRTRSSVGCTPTALRPAVTALSKGDGDA